MQEHNIDELYRMLAERREIDCTIEAETTISNNHDSIILGVVGYYVSCNFTLADSNGLVVSCGRIVKWEDATADDLQGSVEFAMNWYYDKVGEL